MGTTDVVPLCEKCWKTSTHKITFQTGEGFKYVRDINLYLCDECFEKMLDMIKNASKYNRTIMVSEMNDTHLKPYTGDVIFCRYMGCRYVGMVLLVTSALDKFGPYCEPHGKEILARWLK